MRTAVTVLLVLAIAAPFSAADPARPATKCHRVGRGLDRHVTCEVTAPIVITQQAPKPGVLIVHDDDGKRITGRPRSADRLSGLSHQLVK